MPKVLKRIYFLVTNKKTYWLIFLLSICTFSFYDLYFTCKELEKTDFLVILGKLLTNSYFLGSVLYLFIKIFLKKD